MTTNSPIPTVRTESQYGSPKNVNSHATIKALNKTGNIAATTKCLQNMIHKQASNVAIVPNKISKLAVGDIKLARKHPSVNPTEYFLLKKQRRTIISEKRNWIGP